MRNRLIHGYDVVDLNLLWDTVAIDLPPLIAALQLDYAAKFSECRSTPDNDERGLLDGRILIR